MRSGETIATQRRNVRPALLSLLRGRAARVHAPITGYACAASVPLRRARTRARVLSFACRGYWGPGSLALSYNIGSRSRRQPSSDCALHPIRMATIMDSDLLQLLQECELSDGVIAWLQDTCEIRCVRHRLTGARTFRRWRK